MSKRFRKTKTLISWRPLTTLVFPCVSQHFTCDGQTPSVASSWHLLHRLFFPAPPPTSFFSGATRLEAVGDCVLRRIEHGEAWSLRPLAELADAFARVRMRHALLLDVVPGRCEKAIPSVEAQGRREEGGG